MTNNELTFVLDDLAQKINEHHDEAKQAIKKGLEHAIAAGKLLLEAKEMVPHGKWLPWLEANCTVSERSAQLYMRVSRESKIIEAKSATVADLTLRDGLKALTVLPREKNEPWIPVGSIVELRPPDGECLNAESGHLSACIMPSKTSVPGRTSPRKRPCSWGSRSMPFPPSNSNPKAAS